MKKKRNFIRLFDRKISHIDYRVRHEYIRNGVATIFCHISSYNEIITAYSVREHEAVDLNFIEYLRRAASFIPDKCPIVLNIIEDCLTKEEQKTIREVIREELAYDFGIAEQEEQRQNRIFFYTIIGLAISIVFLVLTRDFDEIPRELFFVLFWFMGDTLLEHIFFTGRELRNERRLAGRLASIKVIFSKTYEPPKYTEKDLDKLYTEIVQDMREVP